MSTRRTLSIGLLASAALGSPWRLLDLRPSGSRTPPILTVVAREYSFGAPDSIEAGPTTVRLESRGREQHFVQLVRIASPHTMTDFKQTLKAPGRASWATSVGGVGTIQPGGTAMTTIDLAPGLYAMVCDMEDAKGTPHMMEGMLRSLTVTRTRNAATMPKADVALSLADYSFTLPTPLTAGAHVIEVRNAGSQAHMALLWRLHRDKSANDAIHWMITPTDTGPDPVTLMGGVPDLDVAEAAQLRVQLTPGSYLLICLVDDVPGHKPHYARGMVREFAVEASAVK
jgi:uncharacterized cupredoxin-like copper-binding protein